MSKTTTIETATIRNEFVKVPPGWRLEMWEAEEEGGYTFFLMVSSLEDPEKGKIRIQKTGYSRRELYKDKSARINDFTFIENYIKEMINE